MYCYPMDQTGCGNYRVRWPAMEMGRRGLADIKLVFPGEDAGLKAKMNGVGEVRGVTIPEDCTGVLLQRPTNELLVDTIPYVQAEGIRVVVDIDDDLAAVSPRHPGWGWLHQKSDTGQSWAAVVKACQLADLVIASTPALLSRYAKHGRGAVMKNCLPEAFFDAELVEEKDEHVGWAGGILSHPDDLSVLGAALAQLRTPVKIVGPVPVTSDGKEDWPRVRRLLGTSDVTFTGGVDFDRWIPTISQIHVGMAPLEESRFNVAKSWLKPLEYSVAKVPFVASKTPEYLDLGAGLFAGRAKDWRGTLKSLLTTESLRNDEISRNYEIAQKWKISDHVDGWAHAWLG